MVTLKVAARAAANILFFTIVVLFRLVISPVDQSFFQNRYQFGEEHGYHGEQENRCKYTAPSSCVIIRLLKYPSPLCAPNHSPMAAPMMDMGTAILMAEKKQGSTAGIFSLKKIWRLLAPKVNNNSSISVFTDLNPSNTVMVIGKKVINTVTSTLLQIP